MRKAKMVTIKELAMEAGVSPTTVSIVLRGKAEERKIPPSTQKKVLDAAKLLGYQLNVSARRLRVNPQSSLVIAVFWASDFRAPMMVRFLRGLQEAILNYDQKCELLIHPYQNNSLSDSLMALYMCNVAIICNASAADIEFLESHQFPVPIVLYNRHSDKFCTVNVDDVRMGALPAKIFAARGHARTVIMTSEAVFSGMDTRVESFIDTARQAGMNVQKIQQDNSMQGGYEGGRIICKMDPLPDSIFCMSDFIAVGALRAFHKANIKIPDELEIISIGNGDRELEEYTTTSLSVVHLPMEKMAESCLHLALDLLAGRLEPPHSIEHPIVYRARESCGEASVDAD
jgi:LacI family transcriptional regulator